MMPLFVSFFTPDYEPDALQLAETLREFDLEHKIVPLDSRGTWQKNCTMKPDFIRQCLTGLPLGRGVCWLDADARVRQRPDLLAGITADFACFRIPNVWAKRHRGMVRPWPASFGNDALASGTVFLSNRPTSLEFLVEWHDECEKQPSRWDQQSMQAAWATVQPDSFWLPQSYCKVFDCKWFPHEEREVVIEHMQASRRLKRKVR